MPERIRTLLDRYSASRISDALRSRKMRKMLDSVTKEVIESGKVDGRASGIGNTDYPLVPMEKEIADYTPVGDAVQAIRAAGDALNGHLSKAVLGAGLLFVPNSIEKAAKPIVQSFKNGATRTLRHAPVRAIDYDDALLRLYKGQNFIHHDIPGEYVRDVLSGETRLMSPSLAVNRWGDYNDIYTPGFYGDHVLIGDKSMLDNSRLFNGDGMTPTVGEVWYGMDSVPSDKREKVADDIWRLMESEHVGKNIITDVKDLEHLDLPFSDQYFEAKYRGTYPIENFRYGIFPEPKNSIEEKTIREFEMRGLPIATYKSVGGNEGYNNKVETMLKVLNENQGLLFKCGGKKYPGGGKIDTSEYPTSSTSAYLRGLSDYVLRRKTPKSFVESEYRPTIGDNGEKYYTRPGLRNEVALNLFGGADYGKGVLGGNYFYRDFDDAYNSISGHPLNRDMRATSNGTLGRYSVTAGMDDKGRYLSFTDKFDHVFIPGKPIHIYDRIYENEASALYNSNDSAINLGDALSRSPLLKNMKSSSENKYPGGGKFFRTNLQNESPMMYQPILPSVPDVSTPMRYEPQPHLGLYEYPSTTGMAESYPVTLPPRVPVTVSRNVSAPGVVEAPAENLFSDEMIARRALKQRYAESAFNDKAKSKAGAQGAWQIMPITLKDYLGRGRGKTGDLNDPAYNRKVRDWVMGVIPRDLKEFWSEDDSDRAKLAKLYAAYNWGAGNLRGFLRKKRDAGIDISNPDNWVDDLNPETRRYVKYLAFDEDIPDSTVYTNAAFEKAAAERGYASGGSIHIAPSKRGTFTAAAKKHGKSVQAFASQVLAHKENYSPAMVKKANFARNTAKWHAEGGLLQRYSPEQIRTAISNLKK